MRRPSLVKLLAFGSSTMASEVSGIYVSLAKGNLDSIGQMDWAHIPVGALDSLLILHGSSVCILGGKAMV
jgi:hypothetical protein